VVYNSLRKTYHRATKSHLPYEIAHLTQVIMPYLNPSQTGRHSINLFWTNKILSKP